MRWTTRLMFTFAYFNLPFAVPSTLAKNHLKMLCGFYHACQCDCFIILKCFGAIIWFGIYTCVCHIKKNWKRFWWWLILIRWPCVRLVLGWWISFAIKRDSLLSFIPDVSHSSGKFIADIWSRPLWFLNGRTLLRVVRYTAVHIRCSRSAYVQVAAAGHVKHVMV